MIEDDKVLEWNKKNSLEEGDEKQYHRYMLQKMSQCRSDIEDLMEYFDPPNIMYVGGKNWNLYIRRKGSNVEFGEDEHD